MSSPVNYAAEYQILNVGRACGCRVRVRVRLGSKNLQRSD